MNAVSVAIAPVFCPACWDAKYQRNRYIGMFVGRGQCARCKRWVDAPVQTGVALPQQPNTKSR